jgi:fatty-acyl-CoA synthase
MTTWNFAEAVYQLGDSAVADQPALIHADQVVSFRELRRRALGIAAYLDQLGLPAGAHVGHYLRNSQAYLEMFTGAGLAGFFHVNVNYRYLDEELIGLCNSLDIRVLVYDSEFADRVAAIREQLEQTVAFVEVGEGPGQDFATRLSDLYETPPGQFTPRTSSDDQVLVATGGTTGLPKGTQWRHQDLWHKMGVAQRYRMASLGLEEQPESLQQHVVNVAALGPAAPFLSLSPLMHGAGLMMALLMIAQGTAVVTLPGQQFDPDLALDVIKRHGVSWVVLVGDAFALPLVEALERRADEQLLSSLTTLVSTGASLGADTRDTLLRHKPTLKLLDTLGSSESSSYAVSTPEPGVFAPLPGARVLDDALQEVTPGSDTIGMIYWGGYQPVGYYNAPEKSAETFVEIEGWRYVMTGDRCTLRSDGNLVLLGRDSTVINTGGEKVYTVEVERVLVDHPQITDALVVGLPHPRFGKQVVAVVEGPGLDDDSLDVDAIQAHAGEHLADFKVPRLVFAIPSLQRAPNGKPDYAFVTDYAQRRAEQGG